MTDDSCADGIGQYPGPQWVPTVECSNCGEEHHPDHVTLPEHEAHCRACSAFLRRLTTAETRQFTDFMAWKECWMRADTSQSGGDA